MRCAHCPVESGSCLGQHHQALCRDVALGVPGRVEQLRLRADWPGLTPSREASPALAGLIPPPRRRSRPGRVRVGVLAPILYQGGAESWLLGLARHTQDQLDWQGCCVLGDHADDPAVAAAVGALMPVRSGLAAARELASRSDVLIVWAIDDLPAVLTGPPDRPIVVSVVHSPPGDPWGDRVYARHAGIDHWVAVSELALAALPPVSRDAAPAAVIWNAVDPDRLVVARDRGTMHRLWGVPESALVAGYYGRLSPEKEPLAMARLSQALPEPWQIVAVGVGPLGTNLRAIGSDRLHAPGPDPAAGDVLNAFDVLVVPSRYESFGLTLAEGLWLDVPVVSTEVGIAHLRPGLTRIVAHDAAPNELASAVLAAHATGPLPGARQFARERLAPERFGSEWTDLIEEIAAPVGPDVGRIWAAVDTCEHGQAGPCGCQPGPPRICTRAEISLAVRRPDCFRCQSQQIEKKQ